MRIAAVLLFNQLNIFGVILIENRIVKNQASVWCLNDIALDMFPNYFSYFSSQFISTQKTVGTIMTEALAVSSKVRHCVIGLG